MKLADNVAIVTGGGGSIGGAVARRLADDGAIVVVIDIDRDRAETVAAGIQAAGGESVAMAVDLRLRPAVEDMAAAVLERWGRIDTLVTSAGGSARERSTPFHRSDPETLEWVLGVNLMGVLHCVRAVINPMIERRRGKIVNITSIVAMNGKAGHADYATAKGGIMAFSKSLALEVGPHGVNVNCVSPGLVPRRPEPPEFAARTNILGRVCTPEDVAHLVAFLVSEEASFITGQNYVIDGGRSLGLRGD